MFTEQQFVPYIDAVQVHIIREYAEDEHGKSKKHTCIFNVHGKMLMVEDNISIKLINHLMSIIIIGEGNELELVCADVSSENSDDVMAFISICWVEINQYCEPMKYIGTMFSLSCVDSCYIAKLGCVFDLTAPVAYCRLTDRLDYTNNNHCLIVFGAGEPVSAYMLKSSEDYNLEMDKLDDAYDLFPELSLNILPGAAIRTSCIVSCGLRWSVVGFDSGTAVISVTTTHSNDIVDRKALKFSGPISVLLFLPDKACPSGEELGVEQTRCMRILISSTLGPAVIWNCILKDQQLSWHIECVLKTSQLYDSVTSACLIESTNQVAIATYSGTVLFFSYENPSMEAEMHLSSTSEVNAPIIAIKIRDESTLCLLSTTGLHILVNS